MTLSAGIKLTLILFLLAVLSPLSFAQGGQYSTVISSPEPLPPCTPAVQGQEQPMIWDLTSASLKVCTAPNTWTVPNSSVAGAVQLNPSGNQTITQPAGSALNISGSLSTTTLNNIQYVSKFSGADLGAQMNSAIANCLTTFTACKYVIDTGGTISTPPAFPLGSAVECTATAPITLSTTWLINHRGTTFNFNSCQLNYNGDVSQSAITVAKNLSGTVNCNGTSTVTQVSGSLFTTFDFGDSINIGGVAYNIGTVTSGTSMSIAGTCPTQSGSAYTSGLFGLTSVGGNYPASVTINDLTLVYSGAGSTSSTGINLQLINSAVLNNVTIRNFSGLQSQGLRFNGVLDALVSNLTLFGNKCQMVLDQLVGGGVTITSNLNRFILPKVISGGACSSGISVSLNNGSFGNIFDQPDLEGNATTNTIYSQNGSLATTVNGGDFEVNGDGTSGSTDIVFASGGGNLAENNHFASLSLNTPAIGIACIGSGTFCTLRNNVWDAVNDAYTTSWKFVSSGQGIISGNNTSSSAHTDPVNAQDTAGNYSVNTLSAVGQIKQNGGVNVISIIANGLASMTTAAIGAGACGTTVTVTATGVLASPPDTINYSYSAAVGANPGVLKVNAWPTLNNVNFNYCNPTAGSITPTAANIIFSVTR